MHRLCFWEGLHAGCLEKTSCLCTAQEFMGCPSSEEVTMGEGIQRAALTDSLPASIYSGSKGVIREWPISMVNSGRQSDESIRPKRA